MARGCVRELDEQAVSSIPFVQLAAGVEKARAKAQSRCQLCPGPQALLHCVQQSFNRRRGLQVGLQADVIAGLGLGQECHQGLERIVRFHIPVDFHTIGL